MLKFFVTHGMVVEKAHEIISIWQSRWPEKYISSHAQKPKNAKNDFEKDFYKLLSDAFYAKTMVKVRKSLRSETIKKQYNKIMKQLSKLTFNGIH